MSKYMSITLKNSSGDKYINVAGEGQIVGIQETNVDYTDYTTFQEILEHNNVGYYAEPNETFDRSKAEKMLSDYRLVIVEDLS